MIGSGTNAWITGGSKGLGAALARRMAERGARVALTARDLQVLREVEDGIRGRGGEAFALPGDVGEKTAIHALTAAAQEALGRIDVLVHAASALGPSPLRFLSDTECEDLERALAVNLLGPFRLTKAVAGAMALAGGGLVVHVSSDAAVSAYPKWGAYGASKAAFDHLVRTWATELEPLGVRFLSVDPGDMDTALHREAMPDADPGELQDPEEVAGRFLALLDRSPTLASGSRLVLADVVPAAARAGA
jgi:NAD(P)-dependent dehydrogenase (short-subunit alcohol dehydrogenase family)